MWRACLLLILLSVGGKAGAQQLCPWLTQGTAAALMGEEVSMSVHLSGREGTCDFTSIAEADHSRSGSLHMTIAVSNLPPKECAKGERLTGIGQDAVFCSTDAAGERHDAIRGRVRAMYFVLTLTGQDAGRTNKLPLRRALEQAAEEVAGNLF